MRIQKIFLMVRQTPLSQDRSSAADNSSAAPHGERNITKQHAGMNREIVDTLFGLLDERVAVHLPGQFFRPASGLLECLINRDGADRDRRISNDPLAGFMNVAAGGGVNPIIG